jgi:ferredoxin
MTKIYYFSGTGNTYWSAKKLAEILGDAEIFSVRSECPPLIEASAVVFMFPVYAYGIPMMMRRFIEKSDIHSSYIAALASYGSSAGGALAEAASVLKRKKLVLNYAGRIPAVENYIPIFGSPKLKEKRFAMQKAATEIAASSIAKRLNNRVMPFHPLSAFISALFRFACPSMSRLFHVSSACNACGLCARICPAASISITDAHPKFLKKCEQCQACLNFCPQQAISFGRLRANTERYHHPDSVGLFEKNADL